MRKGLRIDTVGKLGRAKLDIGNKRINLNKIAKLMKEKDIACYFNELFPHSLVVKREKATFLMFTSGNITVSGNYNVKDVVEFLTFFEKKIAKKCLC